MTTLPANPEKPWKLEVVAGGYRVTWLDAQVQVMAERLKQEGDGLKADVAIYYTGAASPGLVYKDRMNLASGQARRSLRKEMMERLPEVEDWYGVIQRSCVEIWEEWRRGEPGIILKGYIAEEGIRWRLEPLLQEGQATVLFGDGGTGKSYLVAYFAYLIQEGIVTRHMAPDPGNVLYLDYEATADELWRRFRALRRGELGEGDVPRVLYRYCSQPLAYEVGEIQRMVTEHDISCLVVDSAGPACGGNPAEPQTAIAYFTALRSLKVTSLTVAHQPKHGDPRHPFGSVFWYNLPRSGYQVRRSTESEPDVLDIALIHRKSNNGRLLKPMGFKFRFMEGGEIKVEHQAVSTLVDLTDVLSMTDRVTEALRVGQKTIQELAEETGITANLTRAVLNRYAGKRFLRLGTNPGKPTVWGLLSPESL